MINRRINRLNIKVEDTVTTEFKDNYIIIAIDSTGIKITNTEEVGGLEANGILEKGI